jgi:hypothetical protein
MINYDEINRPAESAVARDLGMLESRGDEAPPPTRGAPP